MSMSSRVRLLIIIARVLVLHLHLLILLLLLLRLLRRLGLRRLDDEHVGVFVILCPQFRQRNSQFVNYRFHFRVGQFAPVDAL